jgi:hypothetical protein
VFLSKVVQLALTDPKTTPHPPPFLVFPAYLIKPLERFFDDLYCWSSDSSIAIKRWFSRLALQQIRTAVEHGVPPAPVLADAAYRTDTQFREGIATFIVRNVMSLDDRKKRTKGRSPGEIELASVHLKIEAELSRGGM